MIQNKSNQLTREWEKEFEEEKFWQSMTKGTEARVKQFISEQILKERERVKSSLLNKLEGIKQTQIIIGEKRTKNIHWVKLKDIKRIIHEM